MPLARYQAVKSGRCPLCKEGFDQMVRASDPPLEECPRCGGQVKRIEVDLVNSPRAVRKPGTVESKDAGFTVFERNLHGLYEKK